jgi:hypothetical protein
MKDYEKQASDFLEKTGAKLEVKYVKHDFYLAEIQ